MKVLVAGANGFIGKNLIVHLEAERSLDVSKVVRDTSERVFDDYLSKSDVIFHLAGVNRPQTIEEFQAGNADFTQNICARLKMMGRAIPVIFSSTSQVDLDNPYGRSKLSAEQALTDYAQATGAYVAIYRLRNVFGKWCRPNYNSVVATFCHNISHNLPISISNPDNNVQLVYIDDVVNAFASEIENLHSYGVHYKDIVPFQAINLGTLAQKIQSFRSMRESLHVPDFQDEFDRKLYATYLSYLDTASFGYELQKKCDARGCLAEFVKSPYFGQIFVSRTLPGVVRGNHYHHTKVEKFLVLEGEAIIRFRHIQSAEVIEYRVVGEDFRVVDIPPGYTHSIENVGTNELVTLFWASEVFDPSRPDTRMLPVLG